MKDEIIEKIKDTQLYAMLVANKKAATAGFIGVLCLMFFFSGSDDTDNQRYASNAYASNAYASNANVIRTKVDGEWEGCDFDARYRLMNGYILKCSSYFYEYAYMPKVEIFVEGGRVESISINGKFRRGVSVYR